MKSELMSLMVHDLKNPLAALLANLGFVSSCVEGDETAKEAVDDCLLSTEVLGRLVDNLSAINRYGAGDVAVAQGTPVETAVRLSGTRMAKHAAAAMLEVEWDCDPACGTVGVPSAMLELAIDNMVAAALALAPSGSTVRLTAAPRDGGGVRVAVEDEGPPLSLEMKPLLGSADGQLALKGASAGRYARGLGLHVAALVARSGGGSLEGDDREGAGATLVLSLPAG